MSHQWREALVALFAEHVTPASSPDPDLASVLSGAGSVLYVDADQLYAWRQSEKDVLTVNLKTLAGGVLTPSQKVTQILKPDVEVPFDVTAIEMSPSGFHLILVGARDLLLLQLPKRFGRHADFEGGADVCTCIARSLGDAGADLRRVKWHPGAGNLVAVLSADNLLKIYDVNNVDEDGEPSQIFVLSDDSAAASTSIGGGADTSRLSANVALGDVAVDFDFGPSTLIDDEEAVEEGVDNEASSTSSSWPIFVLRESGDVFLLMTGADHASSQFSSRLRGPLTMSPPADDNYGIDACAILCLETTPVPIIAICTRDGRVFHAVPLDADATNDCDIPSTNNWRVNDPVLFVYEAVELELSFNLPVPDDGADGGEDMIECAIQLRKDPTMNDRYYCCHQAGVHAVSLPWAANVEAFLRELTSEDKELAGEPAVMEHLVCTQPLPSVPPQPLRGVGVTKGALLGTPTMICLCHDDSLLTIPLNPAVQSTPKDLLSLAPSIPSASPLKKLEAEPIEKHLRSLLLRRNASNPILKAGVADGGQQLSQQQCLQILVRATQGLRDEYLLRQVQAREELKRRVDLLRESKASQLQQLEELNTLSKGDLKESLEQLADKLNTAQEMQEDLTARADAVIKKLQSQLPILSRAESEMKGELEVIEQRLNVLKGNVEQAKVKRRYQSEQRKNVMKTMTGNAGNHETATLSVTQLTNVKGLLADQGRSLNELVANVKSVKSDLE